jgi:hypothetical protein
MTIDKDVYVKVGLTAFKGLKGGESKEIIVELPRWNNDHYESYYN